MLKINIKENFSDDEEDSYWDYILYIGVYGSLFLILIFMISIIVLLSIITYRLKKHIS